MARSLVLLAAPAAVDRQHCGASLELFYIHKRLVAGSTPTGRLIAHRPLSCEHWMSPQHQRFRLPRSRISLSKAASATKPTCSRNRELQPQSVHEKERERTPDTSYSGKDRLISLRFELPPTGLMYLGCRPITDHVWYSLSLETPAACCCVHLRSL